ncbi:MAG: hypothetical protein M9945_07985 [Aquamicrobium sp.]|uniref:hypothetical protein n=1 Tax=Aquamicrobium sp. TaxID=1872579 RepID=UPI00349E6957|nr:hypothetical protein [Aquamicrobium sp.]
MPVRKRKDRRRHAVPDWKTEIDLDIGWLSDRSDDEMRAAWETYRDYMMALPRPAGEAMRLGGVKPAAIQAPVMPKLAAMGGGGGGNVTVSVPINISAPGADSAALARVEQQVVKLQRDLPATVISTVRKAQKSNVKL